jgi:hypothetical protein
MKNNNSNAPYGSKIWGLLAALFLLGSLMVSCNRETTLPSNETIQFSSNGLTFNYSGVVTDGVLETDLIVLDLDKNEVLRIMNMQFNSNSPNYSGEIATTVSSKANQMATNFSAADIEKISSAFDLTLTEISRTSTAADLSSLETQGLFFNNAIVKGIERNIANGRDPIVATTYEGFDLGLASYVTNEDINIEIAPLLAYIDTDPDATKRGAYVYQEVLSGKTGTITMAQLLSDIDGYIAKQGNSNKTNWWPSGSSHGCCGNYSGPCYFWHPVCYVHDRLCTSCAYSWCFSGCVPD